MAKSRMILKRRQGNDAPAAPSADAGDVAQVAYTLYEQRGCEHGHDVEDWLEAERIVREGQRRPSSMFGCSRG